MLARFSRNKSKGVNQQGWGNELTLLLTLFAVACVLVARRERLDGFDGPIQLKMKGASRGFPMAPTMVPVGEKTATVSIQVSTYLNEYPEAVQLAGNAMVEGEGSGPLRTSYLQKT